MVWEGSSSILPVASTLLTLLSVSFGVLLQYLVSTAQIKRQQAERGRTLLREKLEELSTTIEQFRDGVNTGTMSLLEFGLTGRLREEETGMKKFPRLKMLVRFYAPSLAPMLESLQKVWVSYGEAWPGVVDSRKLGDAETRRAMIPVVSCWEQISKHCDELQSALVKLLRETLP